MTKRTAKQTTGDTFPRQYARTQRLTLGEPRDIAAAVAFLMSDDGEWINGQVMSVDGGVTMR